MGVILHLLRLTHIQLTVIVMTAGRLNLADGRPHILEAFKILRFAISGRSLLKMMECTS